MMTLTKIGWWLVLAFQAQAVLALNYRVLLYNASDGQIVHANASILATDPPPATAATTTIARSSGLVTVGPLVSGTPQAFDSADGASSSSAATSTLNATPLTENAFAWACPKGGGTVQDLTVNAMLEVTTPGLLPSANVTLDFIVRQGTGTTLTNTLTNTALGTAIPTMSFQQLLNAPQGQQGADSTNSFVCVAGDRIVLQTRVALTAGMNAEATVSISASLVFTPG